MESFLEAVGSPEFLEGLRWGGITGGVGLLVGLAWRRWRRERAPVTGLAATLAAALGMAVTHPIPSTVWAGLGLLVLAGVLFCWARRFPILVVFSMLPGAWLIASSGLPGRVWVIALVVGVVAVIGPLVAGFAEESDESSVPAVMLAISVAGVWLTVPDTEEALVLLGAMAIPTLLAWPLGVARLGAIGGHPLIGLYMWVVAWGGRGREGSIVGAVACLGGFVLAPLVISLKRSPVRLPALAVIALHLILVIVGARIAGLRESPLTAASIAALALAITGAGCWIWLRRRDREYVPKRIDGSAEAP